MIIIIIITIIMLINIISQWPPATLPLVGLPQRSRPGHGSRAGKGNWENYY